MVFDNRFNLRITSLAIVVTINYLFLILAAALLWLPRPWLRSGRRAARALGLARRRSRKRDFVRIRESGDNRVNFSEEFGKVRNYVDFLRALTGGLILIGNPDWGISSCFGLSDSLVMAQEDQFIFQLKVAIIAVGVILQFVRFEGRLTFYAPLFYFAGLAFALCGFGAGFFAFLLIWTFNAALPIPPVGFVSVYALILCLMGMLFQGLADNYVYAAAILVFLPVIVSLMARRSLALFTKKMK
jgi:hypothetical protein